MRARPLAAAALLASLTAAACGRTVPLDPRRSDLEQPAPVCGDGRREDPERCDDGNLDSTDACLADCTPARCGDGVVFRGVELCDDANMIAGDGCEPDCAPPPCGNGLVERSLGETCDDGNDDDRDACLSSCSVAFCGDTQVRRGVEECDDGDRVDTDECVSCRAARCGDGFVFAGVEQCDDGNGVDEDGCKNDCTPPFCGDGRLGPGEECDLGPANAERPAFLVEQEGIASFALTPASGGQTVGALYDYRSASSHIGFERAGESRLVLYRDHARGRLALISNHGIDSGTATPQEDARVELDFEGLPRAAAVAVSDDHDQELRSVQPGTARGRWSFDDNTDGGAIDGLPVPADWTITVRPGRWEGIDRWVFVDGDFELRHPLVMDRPVRITSFSTSSLCRTDCTVPRCGDGRLDGGEVCDDQTASCRSCR